MRFRLRTLLAIFLLVALSAPWWGVAVGNRLWPKRPQPFNDPGKPDTPAERELCRKQIRLINELLDSQSDPLKGRLSGHLIASFDFMKHKKVDEFPELFSIAFTEAETKEMYPLTMKELYPLTSMKSKADNSKATGSKKVVLYSFWTDLWGLGNGSYPTDLLIFETVDGEIFDWKVTSLIPY